ncbi:unnamed protein product [Paramecium sonneborni]|uniref:Uncharacterized protein n=1 Tax=Paramecium sonneborni TaxID=65129 RepID=A0A8S1MA40_9CILI|nr:unnamed protein product [Paramecium sonneborni]
MNDRYTQFYGLSIIHFRNLISEYQSQQKILLKQRKQKKQNFGKIIQQMLIKFQNSQLRDQICRTMNNFRQIHQYTINELKGQVQIQIYGQDTERNILLLCSDEHYDIGISKF